MTIPTEPIGSIPRPLRLIEAIAHVGGDDPSVVRSMTRRSGIQSNDSKQPARR